jgi:hypothetical protein
VLVVRGDWLIDRAAASTEMIVHASDLWLRHSGRGGSGARCKTKQVGRGYGKIWLASWLLLSLSFKEVLDLSHGSEEVMNDWRIFHAQM